MPKQSLKSEAGGEVFLKTDPLSRADFSAADSAPFTYVAKGKSRPTSYMEPADGGA